MISPSRWRLKKAARKCFGRFGRTESNRASTLPSLRVLTYHRFGQAERDPWCVSPEEFRRQCAWLAESGRVIEPSRLPDYLAGSVETPRNALLLTIDDGFLSTLSIAAPIMMEYGIPGIAFVTSSRVDTTNPEHPERYMTWDEVRALPEQGIAVGSHAHLHRSLGSLSDADIAAEGSTSRETIERETGLTADTFAYPYGTRRDFSSRTGKVLRECGYSAAFTSIHGVVNAQSDPGQLARVKVEAGDPEWHFHALCNGAMDGWRLVDNLGSGLQRPDKHET